MIVEIDAKWITINEAVSLPIKSFKTHAAEFIRTNATDDQGEFQITVSPEARKLPNIEWMANQVHQLTETAIYHLRVEKSFGRVQIANVKRNLEFCEFHTIKEKGRGKGVILASGPSLNLKTKYHGIIYALPSSLMALHEAKIAPYAVIQLEPGYWAKMHTQYLPEGAILFAPLRGSIPYNLAKKFKIVPYAVSDYEAAEWAKVYKEPILRLTSGPTVAIPALQLVSKLHDSCEVAGLDMVYHDVHGHVRPQTFDYQNYLGDRLNPGMNSLYTKLQADQPEEAEKGIFTTGGLRYMRTKVGHPKEYQYSLGIHKPPQLKPLHKDAEKALKKLEIQGEFEKLPRKIQNA